ncbi:MAG: fibronectin type III domain-containing protein [Thermodesulfovibrionales bacterium]|nr:fibronectin type III domain-containing protein [Thermodesulfovibrionales bacterium]
MRLRASRTLIVLVALSLSLAACGKKAPPRWVVRKAPDAVTDVRVHYRPDQVLLQWKAPEGKQAAEDYALYRAKDGGEPEQIAVVKGTKYIDRDIVPLGAYTYEVVARAGQGMEGPRVPAGTVGARDALPLPEAVSISVEPDGVVITWKTILDISGFNVYRSAEPGRFPPAPRNPVLIRDGRYEEMPDTDKPYYYMVRAAMLSTDGDLFVEGPGSAPVSVAPEDFVPSMPGGMDIAPTGEKVVVFWNENPERWVKGYKVYRAVGKGGEFIEIGTPMSLAFPDRNPPKGILRYRVSALGPAAEGPMSETVEIEYLGP